MKITLLPSIILCLTFAEAFPHWSENIATSQENQDDGYLQENSVKRVPEEPDVIYHTVSFPKQGTSWPEKNSRINLLPKLLAKAKMVGANGLQKRRWYHMESRFPLPERRKFPEVDWRGFNEDVFHESFGDFTPMKRVEE